MNAKLIELLIAFGIRLLSSQAFQAMIERLLNKLIDNITKDEPEKKMEALKKASIIREQVQKVFPGSFPDELGGA